MKEHINQLTKAHNKLRKDFEEFKVYAINEIKGLESMTIKEEIEPTEVNEVIDDTTN